MSFLSRHTVHAIAVLLWLICTFVAFSYFIRQQLVAFDPKRSLVNIEQETFQLKLTSLVRQPSQQLANTVLHFFEKKCRCNNISKPHINKVLFNARKQNMSIINVEVSNTNLVPATPAMALIGSEGELVYFGPYGAGIGCSNTVGFAETVLNNYFKGYNTPTIISDIEGCYCHTALDT